MNNHSPHNHNEQQLDKRPFAHILKRALPHIADKNIDTVQHRSATPEYQITIEYEPIRIGGMRCQHADCPEMRS